MIYLAQWSVRMHKVAWLDYSHDVSVAHESIGKGITMKKTFTLDEKKGVANSYENGKSVLTLSQEHNLSRSTIYYWINKYSKITRPSGEVTDLTKIYLLEKRIKRLEAELAVWQKSGCSINSPIAQKLEAIMLLHETYGIHAVCETLGVRRSTFYHHQRRRPEKTVVQTEDERLKPHISKVFTDSKGRLGAKKIRIKLMELGFTVSAPRITRLMRELGLVCVSSGNAPRRYKNNSCKYYRNKLLQRFTQTEPNKVWVSDIAHLYANFTEYYLCVIIDLFSRKVISYSLSDNNRATNLIGTFRCAYEERGPNELMFHSDQGSQYTSFKFRKMLRERNVAQSFSNTGYPYDNAVAESFFRALRAEETSQHMYNTFEELKDSIDEYINFFNNERPHQKLNYLTPNKFEDNFVKAIS
jgi:transposase InsO family protein